MLGRVCRMAMVPRCTVRHLATPPPALLPFLEQRCKEGGGGWHDEQRLSSLHSSLLSSLQEQEELESMAREEGELGKLAAMELQEVAQAIEEVVEEITEVLVPPEKYDEEDAMVEVVPGAGGQEASLFAEEIFHLYLAYTRSLGFQVEVEELDQSKVITSGTKALPGISRGVMSVCGNRVFQALKFESGVHRVQRVPATEKSGKVQTSTCSVAVLPRPRDIQVTLDTKDLKFAFMRASGAGGQGVNTTDSAVRLTHLPTGLVVESQEQRTPMLNKKIALRKLGERLYAMEFHKDAEAIARDRRFQVGNMNRNEKIRTYNFARHMVTEHRLGSSATVGRLGDWLGGSQGFHVLERFGGQLRAEERRSQLYKLLAGGKG